jgi:hypothetical protein
MRFFTPKEDRFLKANYTLIPAKRMAKMLGRAEGTARQRMVLLGLKVPPEVIAKFKAESYFPKGHESFNKGKKQKEYMSRSAIARTKATQFKKGGEPSNTKYNGCIVIRNDKSGRKYRMIRIAKARWEMLHAYLWKKAGNKIPKGHIVVFKDKDTMNCKLSNLECISRRENMLRNTVQNFPKPIALAIQLRGALNRQINKHEKQNNGSAQPHVRSTRKVG